MDRLNSHYRIEQEIGRGGMGVVYRGVDTRLGRPVAVKVLPPEATADADRRRRFVREAQSDSATRPDAPARPHGSSEATPKGRRTFPSAASAGSRQMPTRGSRAVSC
jgi:serine/threonine protein kinase